MEGTRHFINRVRTVNRIIRSSVDMVSGCAKSRRVRVLLKNALLGFLSDVESMPSDAKNKCDVMGTRQRLDFRVAFVAKNFVVDFCKIACPERLIFYRIHLKYNKIVEDIQKEAWRKTFYQFSTGQILDFIVARLLLLDILKYASSTHSCIKRSAPLLHALSFAVDHLAMYKLPTLREASTSTEASPIEELEEDAVCRIFEWSDSIVAEYRNGGALSFDTDFGKLRHKELLYYGDCALTENQAHNVIYDCLSRMAK